MDIAALTAVHLLGWFDRLVRSLVRELRSDVASYATIGVYFAVCSLYIHLRGLTIFTGLIDQYYVLFETMLSLVYVPIFLLVSVVLSVYRARRQTLPPTLNFFAPDYWARFGAGLVLIVFFILMMTAYSTVKMILPFGQGFPYEALLADVDAFLHGGDPWRYLHAVIDANTVGVFLDYLYGKGWMLYWSALGFWICVSGRANKVRTRYVVCLVLTWGLLGNLVAGFAISAGPIFYERITEDAGRFGDLMIVLRAMAADGATAMPYSDYLWTAYQKQSVGVGSGISAFPSLHVAIATLNALFVRELLGKVAQTLAWLYAAFILFGSVYFGWHYAIDGYASILGVVAIYASVRLIAGKATSLRRPQRDQALTSLHVADGPRGGI